MSATTRRTSNCARRTSWRRRRADRLGPRLQPGLAQPPDQLVEAVLAEERLVAEHHHRDAPVSGGALIDLVLLDDLGEAGGVGVDPAGQLRPAEAGALCGACKVVA